MRMPWIDYETDEGVGAGGDGGTGAPAESAEAPAVTISPEDFQALSSKVDGINRFAETMTSMLEQPLDEQPAQPLIDDDLADELGVDPRLLEEALSGAIAKGIESNLAPYLPFITKFAEKDAADATEEGFKRIAVEKGEFDTGIAGTIALGLRSNNIADTDQAMAVAAGLLVDHDKSVAAKAVEEYKASLGRQADVLPRIGLGDGQGAQEQERQHEVGDYAAVARRHLEQSRGLSVA